MKLKTVFTTISQTVVQQVILQLVTAAQQKLQKQNVKLLNAVKAADADN